MKAIKTLAATAALLASFSSFAGTDIARHLHTSDGYSPADIVAGKAGNSRIDQAFLNELGRSDGASIAVEPATGAVRVGTVDTEFLKQLNRTDGQSA
jgi:hypothetical protein